MAQEIEIQASGKLVAQSWFLTLRFVFKSWPFHSLEF